MVCDVHFGKMWYVHDIIWMCLILWSEV
uniref:Uncharacterized protein n=1 Tax=Anguilla anguilla TaxID=7936 RepID=A0A0E9T527_ANGAN